MAERFQQRVNIQPVQTATGAPQAMMSLVDKLEQFKSFTGGIARQEAQRRGMERAGQVELVREEGITQAPEFQEEGFLGREETITYNKALRSSYLASLDTDNRTALAEIEARNSDNLIGFNDAVASYSNSVLKSVDPSVRQIVANDLERVVGAVRPRVIKADIKKQKQAAEDKILSNVENASRAAFLTARNGEIGQAALELEKAFASVDAMVEAGFRTEKEGVALKREIELEATEQANKWEIMSMSDVSMKDAYDHLDHISKRVPLGFTPDEWDAFISSTQTELNRKASRLSFEAKQLNKQIELNQSVARGEILSTPGIPADPSKGSQDRKDINNAYNANAQAWQQLPPQEQIDKTVQFVQGSGMLPDTLLSKMNAVMRSGSPEQANAFVNFSRQISKEPGAANILRDVPAETRAIMLMTSENIELGISPEESLLIARKNALETPPAKKEQIKLEVAGMGNDLPTILADKLDEEFDPATLGTLFGLIGEEPGVNSAIQAEFNVAFNRHMMLTDGNSDQSATLAYESIRKFWTESNVGPDKRFMKYAPELFYSIQGIDNTWIGEQFSSDMKAAGFDPDNVTIAVDRQALTGDTPRWPVFQLDEDGIPAPLFDNRGNAILWAPDFKQTREYHKLKARPADAVKQAKESREAIARLNEINTILGIKELEEAR